MGTWDGGRPGGGGRGDDLGGLEEEALQNRSIFSLRKSVLPPKVSHPRKPSLQ